MPEPKNNSVIKPAFPKPLSLAELTVLKLEAPPLTIVHLTAPSRISAIRPSDADSRTAKFNDDERNHCHSCNHPKSTWWTKVLRSILPIIFEPIIRLIVHATLGRFPPFHE
jgi:hypothetical protein